MKNFTLKFFLLALLCVGAQTALADDIKWTEQSDWTGIGGASISLTYGDYKVTVVKNDGSTNPTVNANFKDLRAYAKATVTIDAKKNMKTIVFKISAQGMKRMTEITPNTGEVKFDKDAKTLTWTGDASSVSFTVGDKATLGTDGADKAGQFDVDSPITVVAEGGGAYVPAPVITPATGTFTEAQTVTITAEAGLRILYSLDNVTYNYYYNPFTVSETTTVSACAEDKDGNKSSFVSSTITIVDLGEVNGKGTLAEPYDVASALKLITAGAAPSNEVYVKGKVSSVDASSWSAEYKTLIYFISDDGTTTSQLEVYRGKALNNEGFESADALKVNDNVVVYGKLVYYNNNTPEFTSGNYLAAWNENKAVLPPTITPGSGLYTEAQTVTISVEAGEKAYYSINDGEAKLYNAPFTVSQTATITAYAVDASGNQSADETVFINIISGTASGDGSVDNPYNVTAALNLMLSGVPSDEVYVKGKISKIEQINTSYGDATYLISNDASATAGQLKIFQGKYLNKANFTKDNQISVEDEVVVCGKLTYYENNTAEMDKGNYIYTLNGSTTPPVAATYKTIAAAKAAATAEKVTVALDLTGVTVTFVKDQSTYIADATDGFLLFGKDLGMATGQVVDVKLTGELYLYNGLPEIAVTKVDALTVKSEGKEINPKVVEVADLKDDPMKYSNLLVMIEGASYDATAFENRNVTIYQDGEDAVVRDNWSVATSAEFDTDEEYDIIGFVAIFSKDGTTTVQLYPRSIEDLGLEKKPIEIVGEGTFEKPYTVNDALQLYTDGSAPEDAVWVKGIIVGNVAGTAISKAVFAGSGEGFVASNVIIADDADANDVKVCLPVNLPTDPKDKEGNVIPNIRGKVNLVDNPGNYLKEVIFLGKIQAYFQVAGLKDVKDAYINGEHANEIIDIAADDIRGARTIYTIAGQRVNNITTSGLYIINGKKVFVK